MDNNKAILGIAIGATVSLGIAYKYYQSTQLTPIEKTIRQRRTIQPDTYDPTRPVPRAILDRLLEAANWAPNHGKTQPWRFIVFSGKALKTLGDLDAKLYKEQTPAKAFKEKRYLKKMRCKLQSTYVIAIGMERQPSEQIPHDDEMMAVACAVQNMQLAATALGVGCYWHSGPNIDSPEMRAFLQLNGPKDHCYGFLTVGYSSQPLPVGKRQPISTRVRFVD